MRPEYGVHIVKAEFSLLFRYSLVFLLGTLFLHARYRIPPFNYQQMSLRKTGERYNRITICETRKEPVGRARFSVFAT